MILKNLVYLFNKYTYNPLAFTFNYTNKVKNLSPIAYWPLDENIGSIANDASGNNRNGIYSGVTLNQAGIGDGRTGVIFDGINDFIDIYSNGLNSAFNGAEGTIMLWIRVSNSSVWNDSSQRYLIRMFMNSTNEIRILKTANNNQIATERKGSGIAKTALITISSTNWIQIVLTWSITENKQCTFVNGLQVGSTLTDLPAITGILTNTGTIIGSLSTSPSLVWFGSIAHVAIWSYALNPTTIANLGVV